MAEAAALAAAGALQSVACVHTGLWWLSWLAVAGLVLALHRVRPARAAGAGLAFGTGWLLGGVWWLFISLHRYGGLPAPLAVAAVLLLCVALSLYLAVACAVYARWRSGRAGPDIALFAACWALAEWARGVLFTGFPWAASGYTQIDGPLAPLAPWVGVYGIGAAMAALAAGLAWAVTGGRKTGAVPAAVALCAVIGLWAAGPAQFTRPVGVSLGVTLLQTNVPQDEKFLAERTPEVLQTLAEGLRAARGPLVVAPETAVPLLPSQLEAAAPDWWPELAAHFAQPGRALLVGRPLGGYEEGYTNSVVGLAAGAAAYRYDKAHLVPFGEFIPRGFRWFTELMNIPLGDFARGPLNAASFGALGQRLAPNVCYEDLFGEELAQRFVEESSAPTVLVNVSNIAWFGDSIAIPQHLNISRMRALELQRPMLRATNTGATAVVDHGGRVTHALAPFTRAALDAQVQGRQGTTAYAAWAGRFGLWPLAWLALAVIAWRVAAHRRGLAAGASGRAAP